MNAGPMRVLETVLGWVVHAGWQAAVLGLIVLGVSWMPRRYLPADWRLGLWLVVLVRLAMPVTVPIPWSPWRLTAPIPLALTWHQSPSDSRESPSVPPSELEPRGPAVIPSLPPADAVLPASPDEPDHSDGPTLTGTPIPWLALGWLAGVVLLLGRLGWLGRRLARQRQVWQTVVDPCVRSLFQSVAPS